VSREKHHSGCPCPLSSVCVMCAGGGGLWRWHCMLWCSIASKWGSASMQGAAPRRRSKGSSAVASSPCPQKPQLGLPPTTSSSAARACHCPPAGRWPASAVMVLLPWSCLGYSVLIEDLVVLVPYVPPLVEAPSPTAEAHT